MRGWHETVEALRIGVEAIRANKARGVLTTLGIVIGVMGVSTTMTAANGLASSFRESVSALGSDVVYVSRMPWIITGNFFEFRNRPNVSLKEAEKLERRLVRAAAVNPTTHTQPTYLVDGVIHYCVANMPGAVPRTSTFALNAATRPFIVALADKGLRRALMEDENFRNGLNVHEGRVTCRAAAGALGYPYTPANDAVKL